MLSTHMNLILTLSLFSSSALALPGLVGACANPNNISMIDVDPVKYGGAWYEIAKCKSFFIDCYCSTAEYTFLGDGRFRVLNSCRRKTGALYQIGGQAKQVEPGRLAVNFFFGLPFANGDYRIIYVDEGYNLAIVASCSRLGGSLIWFLSRTPQIDDAVYDTLVDRTRDLGFDVSDLIRNDQTECWSFKSEQEATMREPLKEWSSGLPEKCSLPSNITSFPVKALADRWHVLYTQPDFVENIFSKNCYCNTVTLKRSDQVIDDAGKKYPGTFQSTVACRERAVNGPRSDFVRPVFEISNATSKMAHFTQRLWGGLSQEHWQILAYGDENGVVQGSTKTHVDESKIQHMLLYTCLDAKIFGKSYCLHIVSRSNTIDEGSVQQYIDLAKRLGIYQEKKLRPVVHSNDCVYDPSP